MIISFFHSFLELRQYTFFVNNGKIVKFLWKCFLQWKLQNNVLKCVHICVVCFIQLRFFFEILISEKIIASLENPFSLVNQFFFSFVLTIPVFICHENILMFDFYLLYFKIILQLIWKQCHLRNQKIHSCISGSKRNNNMKPNLFNFDSEVKVLGFLFFYCIFTVKKVKQNRTGQQIHMIPSSGQKLITNLLNFAIGKRKL